MISTTSAKVIEVQSITDDNLKDDKLSAVDNLENAPKDETKAQETAAAESAENPGPDIAVEDILSLEKILMKELANISTSKLSLFGHRRLRACLPVVSTVPAFSVATKPNLCIKQPIFNKLV